jgi:hypothetical protein
MRAMHRVDSIFEATKRILGMSKDEGINPNQAAIRVAELRIKEIGDLRRFRRSGDDRN